MNILVCVKRVPLTGGKIVLTDDEQGDPDPPPRVHDQPARGVRSEEAVRLIEQHGGSSTVLTLGPPEAEEQLRDMMAIGIDRAVHLVTDGSEWDPRPPPARSSRRSRPQPEPFDLILFGNESADAGNYQVGDPRRAQLGLPSSPASRRSRSTDGGLRCEQEVPGGRDVYVVPMPAVVTRQGGHQPAALSLGAGPAARQAQAARAPRRPTRPEPRLEMVRLKLPPGSGKQAEVLGDGPDAAPAVVGGAPASSGSW